MNAAQIAESIDQEIGRLTAMVAELEDTKAALARLEATRTALGITTSEQTTESAPVQKKTSKRTRKPKIAQETKRGRGRPSKLTQEIADQIRATDGSASAIARQYDISRTTVANIKQGKSWAPKEATS